MRLQGTVAMWPVGQVIHFHARKFLVLTDGFNYLKVKRISLFFSFFVRGHGHCNRWLTRFSMFCHYLFYIYRNQKSRHLIKSKFNFKRFEHFLIQHNPLQDIDIIGYIVSFTRHCPVVKLTLSFEWLNGKIYGLFWPGDHFVEMISGRNSWWRDIRRERLSR